MDRARPAHQTPMPPRSFDRSAGAAAVLAGALGFLYSVAFVIASRAAPETARFLAALFLMLGGIATVIVLAALYARLRGIDGGYALVGLAFGLAGALGAALHGAYDLANALHPPAALADDVPYAVDPRGFLTFASAGFAVLVFASLMSRHAHFPGALSRLGYLSGTLLVLIYLGRLIVLDAASPLVLAPAGLEGFIVNPAWYLWLGAVLRREHAA